MEAIFASTFESRLLLIVYQKRRFLSASENYAKNKKQNPRHAPLRHHRPVKPVRMLPPLFHASAMDPPPQTSARSAPARSMRHWRNPSPRATACEPAPLWPLLLATLLAMLALPWACARGRRCHCLGNGHDGPLGGGVGLDEGGQSRSCGVRRRRWSSSSICRRERGRGNGEQWPSTSSICRRERGRGKRKKGLYKGRGKRNPNGLFCLALGRGILGNGPYYRLPLKIELQRGLPPKINYFSR